MRQKLAVLNVTLFFMALMVQPALAEEDCLSISHKPVKLEAWLSKRYENYLTSIRKDLGGMGNTRVGLFVYPTENPSRVVAIGRCVPAYIAQYILTKADEYKLGTTHLVNQGFVSSHWTGIGTSLFSENSMNAITPQQLDALMDDTLNTESFHEMYRALTRQPEKVQAFGLMLKNPKYMTP
jgi:hypothetical protein